MGQQPNLNPTVEESKKQAAIINQIAYVMMNMGFDLEYCRFAAKDFLDQAHRQESISVLNPNHPQIKNDILRLQGQALDLLCDYHSTLLEITRLKTKLEEHDKQQQKIDKLFY